MSFTDDDVKQVKELLEGYSTAACVLRYWEIDALIARLEAAENALDHNVPTDPDYIAWRKAAGR